jgi:hypothetical protein
VTQPPPYGYPPPHASYPTSGAPQQPDPWGPQQPASWGQQPPQQRGQQPDQWGQQQPGQWGQQPQGEWGQQSRGQWGQQPQGEWGQQPPGQWGQQQPPPYPPQRKGTNGFAIASLIFGVLGGILLGLIFGFVALAQIRRRGQGGKGLAIAGISLSGVWFLVIVSIAVIAALNSGTDPSNPTASTAAGGDVKVQQLKTGQCLNGLEESSAIRNLPVVPCAQPHEGEVFAVFELADGDYPGDQAVAKLAEDGCVDRLETSAPKAADNPDLEIYFLHPTRSSWRLGDQGVTCVAMSSTGKVTGSIQD